MSFRYVDRAAALTNHPPGLIEHIKICNSVYHFEFSLRRFNERGEEYYRGDQGVAGRAQPPQDADRREVYAMPRMSTRTR
jgi:hypothetical protein